MSPACISKFPLLQTVRKFPSRILKIDDAPQRVFTLERTAMTVDYFVKWRIVDEVSFYTSTGGISGCGDGSSSRNHQELDRYRIW